MAEKLDLSEAFKSSIDIAKDGTVKVAEDCFTKVLEVADIPVENYQAVTNLNGSIAAQLTEVFAAKALPIFKANKTIDRVSATLPTVGRDSFSVTIDRKAKYRNPADGSEVVKYGIVNLQHNVIGTRKGQYGAVRKMINEQWSDAQAKL